MKNDFMNIFNKSELKASLHDNVRCVHDNARCVLANWYFLITVTQHV